MNNLPRYAYWLAGAVIACGGAITARFIGEVCPAAFQVPVWLTGGALIFVGLAVISMGSRGRLGEDGEQQPVPPADRPFGPPEKDAGALHGRFSREDKRRDAHERSDRGGHDGKG